MMTRRTLGFGALGAAAAGLGLSHLMGGSEAKEAKKFPVALSNDEWKKKLSAEQYRVLRDHGTERAGTRSSIPAPGGRASSSPSKARSASRRTTPSS
jgi:hypothetical protein